MDIIFNFFDRSGVVTLLVTALLFVFMFLVISIFLSRYFSLQRLIENEQEAFENLLISSEKSLNIGSLLYRCFYSKTNNRSLSICYNIAEKTSTVGVTWLSIIATLSPFVGLFGTVVGILQAFSTFSDGVGLSTIAPAISEALIATAMGILVAIPAYGASLIIRRKAYELMNVIKSEIAILEK